MSGSSSLGSRRSSGSSSALDLRDLMLQTKGAEELEGLLEHPHLRLLHHPEAPRSVKPVKRVVRGNVTDEGRVASQVDDRQQSGLLDVERVAACLPEA